MTVASSVFLASIPSPDRGVWELGPIPIRAYALCVIAGIIAAIWWGERRWIARGGTPGTIIDISVFAVPFGLVGGRLYHVITDNQLYFGADGDPVKILMIWDGGLGIWGAIALGAVGAWIGCRVKKVPLPVFADAIAPGVVLGQAIGRLGNYFNQELYGGPTDLPWGLEIYRRINEAGAEDNLNGVAVNHIPVQVVHPTFLYELLWNLGVVALVVWADRRFRLGHGRAFAVYVAGYTAGRTWIELMRSDPANEVFGARVNVWVSIVVFLGAIAYLVLAKRRGPREDLAAIQGSVPPDTGEPEAVEEAKADEASESDESPAGKVDAKADEPTDADGEKADETAKVDEPTKAEATKADATKVEATKAEPADASAADEPTAAETPTESTVESSADEPAEDKPAESAESSTDDAKSDEPAGEKKEPSSSTRSES